MLIVETIDNSHFD